MWEYFYSRFYLNFIEDDGWKYITVGLKNTLIITFFACLMGIVLGFLVGMVRSTYEKTHKLKILNAICKVYLTVIRGTPMVTQLLIMVNIVFAAAKVEHSIYVAMLSFGINSGAYVAEIIRAGINAVDRGQMEAGRSLGLPGGKTMRLIILPQAVKNILPALGNEFIVLVKETAVVGYVAVQDLTKAANWIQTKTFQPVVPLLLSALIYLVLVMLMTWGLKKLERRLGKSDYR